MILVTGASGHVGTELVMQLVALGEAVRAMTRRPEALRAEAGVETVAGDFTDPASLDAALNGVDRVFAMSAQPAGSEATPTHDLALAAACRRAGVRRIVKLSILRGRRNRPGRSHRSLGKISSATGSRLSAASVATIPPRPRSNSDAASASSSAARRRVGPPTRGAHAEGRDLLRRVRILGALLGLGPIHSIWISAVDMAPAGPILAAKAWSTSGEALRHRSTSSSNASGIAVSTLRPYERDCSPLGNGSSPVVEAWIWS